MDKKPQMMFKVGDNVLCEDGQSGDIVEVDTKDSHPYRVSDIWYKEKHLQLIPYVEPSSPAQAQMMSTCSKGHLLRADTQTCTTLVCEDFCSINTMSYSPCRNLIQCEQCPDCFHPKHEIGKCNVVVEPIMGLTCCCGVAPQPEPMPLIDSVECIGVCQICDKVKGCVMRGCHCHKHLEAQRDADMAWHLEKVQQVRKALIEEVLKLLDDELRIISPNTEAKLKAHLRAMAGER
jgi:hypothetical protein